MPQLSIDIFLFLLQGMTGHEMTFTARTAIPMLPIMVLRGFALLTIPELATWLPGNIRQGPGG